MPSVKAQKQKPPHTSFVALFVVILSVFFLISGCTNVTVWSTSVISPDGFWKATAKTVEHAGPGADGVTTEVFLKQKNQYGPATQILSFWHTPKSRQDVSLTMKWNDSKHLSVAFKDAEMPFQVLRFQGIEISTADLSSPK